MLVVLVVYVCDGDDVFAGGWLVWRLSVCVNVNSVEMGWLWSS